MAYSPTSGNVTSLGARLRALRDKSSAFRNGGIAVLGTGYWPLPWYLRETAKAGYFTEPPPGVESFPLVVAMPETTFEASKRLSATHEVFYNGLRSEVPLAVFVRRDVYREEMAAP
jgi:predicted membrane-bound mannosyltransferase